MFSFEFIIHIHLKGNLLVFILRNLLCSMRPCVYYTNYPKVIIEWGILSVLCFKILLNCELYLSCRKMPLARILLPCYTIYFTVLKEPVPWYSHCSRGCYWIHGGHIVLGCHLVITLKNAALYFIVHVNKFAIGLHILIFSFWTQVNKCFCF